eukprot:357902-Chlamydomonas_euryale.AAC.11
MSWPCSAQIQEQKLARNNLAAIHCFPHHPIPQITAHAREKTALARMAAACCPHLRRSSAGCRELSST